MADGLVGGLRLVAGWLVWGFLLGGGFVAWRGVVEWGRLMG